MNSWSGPKEGENSKYKGKDFDIKIFRFIHAENVS